jgi:large subunit ribosomal protein L30
MSTLRVTQTRSRNGTNGKQRDTLRSLGLRRIGQTVEHKDTPQLRGMVHAVAHLVKVNNSRPDAEAGHQNAGPDDPRRSA